MAFPVIDTIRNRTDSDIAQMTTFTAALASGDLVVGSLTYEASS